MVDTLWEWVDEFVIPPPPTLSRAERRQRREWQHTTTPSIPNAHETLRVLYTLYGLTNRSLLDPSFNYDDERGDGYSSWDHGDIRQNLVIIQNYLFFLNDTEISSEVFDQAVFNFTKYAIDCTPDFLKTFSGMYNTRPVDENRVDLQELKRYTGLPDDLCWVIRSYDDSHTPFTAMYAHPVEEVVIPVENTTTQTRLTEKPGDVKPNTASGTIVGEPIFSQTCRKTRAVFVTDHNIFVVVDPDGETIASFSVGETMVPIPLMSDTDTICAAGFVHKHFHPEIVFFGPDGAIVQRETYPDMPKFVNKKVVVQITNSTVCFWGLMKNGDNMFWQKFVRAGYYLSAEKNKTTRKRKRKQTM